jgi:hypothetical protein
LNFEDYSVIQEVDDDKKIQVNTFEIKKIESVARMELGSFIDILGVVKVFVWYMLRITFPLSNKS